jgi:hypothetical protein
MANNLYDMSPEELNDMKGEFEEEIRDLNEKVLEVDEELERRFVIPAYKTRIGKAYKYGNSFGRDSSTPPWEEYFLIQGYNEESYSYIIKLCFERQGLTAIQVEEKPCMYFDEDSLMRYEEITASEYEEHLGHFLKSMG